MIKKLSRLNSDGTVGVSIPKKLVDKLGWSSEDFVNISVTGNALQIVKVKIE